MLLLILHIRRSSFFARSALFPLGLGTGLCRMYAGRGHTTPSSCDQKMQFDRDQVFLTAADTAFWGSSRRSKHEKAEANLDIERCSYLEEACKEKDASGKN